MNRMRTRPAFTLIELAALTAAAAVGAAAFTVATQPSGGAPKPAAQPGAKPKDTVVAARDSARQLKDSTQVRNVVQSLIVFAGANKDVYPLPSALDSKDWTVAEKGRAKDTTANIFSILVYNGSISTEFCVSPAESNPSITANQSYEFSDPKAAKKPGQALWDPAFSADFTGEHKGNVSYANQQPSGKVDADKGPTGRLARWSNTFSTTEAAVGNRGPEVESVSAGDDGTLTAKLKSDKSNTFLIHGPKDSWEGNIGYNDGHVNYETVVVAKEKPGVNKAWPTYTTKDKKSVYDCHFSDETDDPEAKNNFLGIFIKAGEKPADYKAIWD